VTVNHVKELAIFGRQNRVKCRWADQQAKLGSQVISGLHHVDQSAGTRLQDFLPFFLFDLLADSATRMRLSELIFRDRKSVV
jgi:hypothetical protein